MPGKVGGGVFLPVQVKNIYHGRDADKSASPDAGDLYIATDTNKVYACFSSGTWTELVSGVGDMLKATYDTDESDVVDKAEDLVIGSQVAGDILYFDGDNWVRLPKGVGKYLKSGASAPAWDEATIGFSFAIPIDTPETVGADKGVFHFAPGVAGTIEEVYIMAKTAPGTDKTLTVDVHKGGTTIFTTQANRPSLVDTAKTATSGTPDVTTFAKNDLFTIDVDVSTATTAVAAVVVLIRGKQKVA